MGPLSKILKLSAVLLVLVCGDLWAQTWQELQDQGLEQQQQKHPEKALEFFHHALVIKEPKDDFETTKLYFLIGKAERQLSHHEQALEAFLQAKSRIKNRQSRAYAEILTWTGLSLLSLNRLDEAVENIRPSLRLHGEAGWVMPDLLMPARLMNALSSLDRKEEIGFEATWLLKVLKDGLIEKTGSEQLNQIGVLTYQAGYRHSAKELFQMSIQESRKEKNILAESGSSQWLAIVLYELKEFEQALSFVENAEASLDDPSSKLQLQVQKGAILLALGRHQDALTYLQLSNELPAGILREVMKKKLGEAARFVGQFSLAIEAYTELLVTQPKDFEALENRALCFLGTGEADKALLDLDRVLELRPADARAERGLTLSRRAMTLAVLERNDEALESIRESLSLQDETDRERLGLTLNTAAQILFSTGDYQMSIQTGQQALEHLETAQPLPRVMAQVYKYNASRLHSLGKLEKAAELFEKSHKAYVESLGAEHPDTIGCAMQLASVWVEQGKIQEGLGYYERLVPKLAAQTEGPNLSLVFAREMWAVALRRAGQLDKALEQLALAEAAQSDDYQKADTLSYRASIELQKGNWEEAYRLSLDAVNAIPQQEEDESLGRLNDYRQAGLCALRLYQTSGKKLYLTESRDLFDKALKLSQVVRNRVDDKSRRIQSEKHLDLFPLAIEACAADQDISRAVEIAELSTSRALLELLAGNSNTSESGRSREKLRGLLKRSGVTNEQLTTSKVIDPLKIDALANVLADDEVGLYLVLGPRVSHGFFLDGHMWTYFPMASRSEIEKVALTLSQQLAKGQVRAKVLGGTKVSQGKRIKLGELLFSKFPKDLAEKIQDKKLVIIPTGHLLEIPFEVLPPLPGQPGKYLIENQPIIYSPSLSLLHHLRNRPTTTSQKTAFLLADPTYGGPVSAMANRYRSSDSSLTFSSLPFTREEAKAIAGELGSQSCTIMLGDEANEEKLLKADLSKFQILHFACHGILGRSSNLGPALVLAQGQSSAGDGFLTMAEIQNLDSLTADLVVLSACQTGRGQFQAGEGVESLARSFMLSGAQAVVVSLWTVDDRSTSQLMTKMYGYLRKGQIKPSEALRQARLDLIAAGSPPGHWAPFILIGDDRGFTLSP